MLVNYLKSKYRVLFLAGILALFLTTATGVFLVWQILETYREIAVYRTLNFVKSTLAEHLAIVKLIPQAPEYFKDVGWLTDEFQSQPFLAGVYLRQGQEVPLNTFPQGTLEAKDIWEGCHQGVEYRKIFFQCESFEPLPGEKYFLLLGFEVSFIHQLFHRTLLSAFLVLALGTALLSGAYFYIQKLVRRQELLQERLLASERLAAMGKLAAMVAHEIRNPLNAVVMGLQFMAETRELRPDLLQRIHEEARRLTELTSELLSLSKGFIVKREPFRVYELFSELKARLAPKARRQGVAFSVDLPSEDLIIQGDKRWLSRALENLIRNSLEALKAEGWIKLGLEVRGKEAVFWVQDSGPGIEPEVKARLFEPGYTTKESGFGLGLYIVAKVAEAHGGKVWVETPPEGGAVFKLKIPKAISD